MGIKSRLLAASLCGITVFTVIWLLSGWLIRTAYTVVVPATSQSMQHTAVSSTVENVASTPPAGVPNGSVDHSSQRPHP